MSPRSLVSLSYSFVLILILLIAAAFRFYGLAWDSGYLFHPDERKILLVAGELRLPANVLDFFSAESPLNPRFFAYGSFPIYLLRGLGAFLPTIPAGTPWREDLVGYALLGRALSAFFDLGTLLLLFLLARRLYDARVGLIAAACVAVTVLHIQLAHFYAVDTLLTLLVLATMYFAARFAQTGARRDALALGAAFGLALATKTSALPLIVPIGVAVVRAQSDTETKSHPVTRSPYRRVRAELQNWLGRIKAQRTTLATIGSVALAAFVLTQPYALLDPMRFFGQVGTEWLVARGWLDYPYTRQYADTLPFVYPIVQSSVWGMGVPLGVFAWGGSALFVWRWWRARAWRDGFILAWALVYFFVIGGQYTKYPRYLLPLLPFLYLMAASAFKVQGSKFKVTRFTYPAILSAVYCLLFTASLAYAIAFTSIYSREHPWLQISRWIYANVPAGSTLAVEHWDDVLPVPMRVDGQARTPTEYRFQTLPMYDADDAAKTQTIADVLASSDYVILATQRLSAPITRWPARYPISSRYYRLLFDGQLGFDLAMHAYNGIALDGVVIVDERFDGVLPPGVRSDALVWSWGRADESFTVYDHPLPLVFQKTRALSRGELDARLSP